MAKRQRVVIEVRGGVVVAVFADAEAVEAVLVDWDNIGESAGEDGKPTEGAVVFSVEPLEGMSIDAAALVSAAVTEAAEGAETPYLRAMRFRTNESVTISEAEVFERAGYTPKAAAYEVNHLAALKRRRIAAGAGTCECGREVHLCATADEPGADHGDRK